MLWRRSTLATAALVLLASLSANAATIEKPIKTKFKDTPLDQNPISGYVQFGQLPDGSPAVQKVDGTTARFYERMTAFKPAGLDGFFNAMEVDCSSGKLTMVGMGTLDRITAMADPPIYNVKQTHPKNWPVFREVCTAVGLKPSW